MINLIVWSKDRACQLELLLRSLDKNLTGLMRPVVIYKASNDKYKEAYSIVENDYEEALFVEETDFYTDTMAFVYPVDGVVGTAFSTDDTVIYYRRTRDDVLKYNHIENELKKDRIISLRYGINTIIQDYHTGRTQPILKNYFPAAPGMICWSWNDYHPHDNYGYPMGLDMHIYPTQTIYNIMKEFHFNTTNELETNLFHNRQKAPFIICSPIGSIAVNIPANSISGVTRAGEVHGYSTETLNDAFLDGKRINLESIEAQNIVGSHQEVPLELK